MIDITFHWNFDELDIVCIVQTESVWEDIIFVGDITSYLWTYVMWQYFCMTSLICIQPREIDTQIIHCGI